MKSGTLRNFPSISTLNDGSGHLQRQPEMGNPLCQASSNAVPRLSHDADSSTRPGGRVDKGKARALPDSVDDLSAPYFDPNEPSTSRAAIAWANRMERRRMEQPDLRFHSAPSSVRVSMRSASRSSSSKHGLTLSDAQRLQILEHIAQMASLSPELHSRKYLFRKPSSKQYQYAKTRMDKDGRTLLARVLQARVQGLDNPEWQLDLSESDAMTMWLSIQHARLSMHTISNRRDYRAKQRINMIHFGVGLLTVPIFGFGILPLTAAAREIRRDRETYYNSAYRPEYGDAFNSFMEMLASVHVNDELKIRVARALVHDHMQRIRNILPDHATDIEAAIREHAARVLPHSNDMPLLAVENPNASYYGVISYAESSAWRKKLSEVQCNELLMAAGRRLKTAQHTIKAIEASADQAASENNIGNSSASEEQIRRERLISNLNLHLPQKPLPDVPVPRQEVNTSGRRWNARNYAPHSMFGPISSFQNRGYESMNRDLRNGIHRYDAMELNGVLNSYIPSRTYFGLTFRGSFALDKSRTQTPYCIEGGTFIDRGFFSTTRSANYGEQYTRQPPIKSIASRMRWGNHNTMFHVIGINGVDIGGLEQEVLFRTDTRFDVLLNAFDHRREFYTPVLAEVDPHLPSGRGKHFIDIPPSITVSRAIKAARGIHAATFGTPREELNFHIATALLHLPYERWAEILFEHIAWPSWRITRGESDSARRQSALEFYSALPRQSRWIARNLPILWTRLRNVIPGEIFARFNERLTLNSESLMPLVNSTIDGISRTRPDLIEEEVRSVLLEGIDSALNKRANRIVDYKDAKAFESEIYQCLKKYLKKTLAQIERKKPDEETRRVLRSLDWGYINWRGFAARHAVPEYPDRLEEIVRDHIAKNQAKAENVQLDCDALIRNVIRTISSYSTSEQVMNVLEPYLRDAKEASEDMINMLNAFFRKELRFPHRSFQQRYGSNAANYPFRLSQAAEFFNAGES